MYLLRPRFFFIAFLQLIHPLRELCLVGIINVVARVDHTISPSSLLSEILVRVYLYVTSCWPSFIDGVQPHSRQSGLSVLTSFAVVDTLIVHPEQSTAPNRVRACAATSCCCLNARLSAYAGSSSAHVCVRVRVAACSRVLHIASRARTYCCCADIVVAILLLFLMLLLLVLRVITT